MLSAESSHVLYYQRKKHIATKLSADLVCVGEDDINKFKSKLKPVAECLQQCAYAVAGCDLQPRIGAVRQNNTTNLLHRVTVNILQHSHLLLIQTTQLVKLFLLLVTRDIGL